MISLNNVKSLLRYLSKKQWFRSTIRMPNPYKASGCQRQESSIVQLRKSAEVQKSRAIFPLTVS